ncbi:MAG: hypothetical protein ACXWC8_02240 [Limisphaerales bacterium]
MKPAFSVEAQQESVPASLRKAAAGNDLLRPIAIMAVLTLLMFIDVLFQGESVLSMPDCDMASQFIYWREFGFTHLRHGDVPLWNPHIFGGAPFFGGFQSALLYPLNALFLFLPLGFAINWSIALHVFLAGAFTFLWLRNHVTRWPAALLGALMTMFGGSYFVHISAGHLSNLCTMVWVPLVFLSIEKIADGANLPRCLFAISVATMMVLAGHPQYVFYTAIASALYVVCLLAQRRITIRSLAALAVVGIAAISISAVQLLTGLQEASEGLRSIPLSYTFAGMFPFPPEDLLTSIAPWFFGNLQTFPYWGRCYIFEMSVFASVTGVVLAVYGAIGTRSNVRTIALVNIALLLLLALGAHTPLFKVLYDYVPGFNRFRGISKFVYFAAIWCAMLAALGFDKLLSARATSRALMLGTLSFAVLIGATALWLRADGSAGTWRNVVAAAHNANETADDMARVGQYSNASFLLQARHQATNSLWITAATLLAVAALLFATRFSTRSTYGLLVIATVELFVFARCSVITFDLASATSDSARKVLAEYPGDYRVYTPANPNCAMILGGADIMGNDPSPTLRYAQFVAASEGIPPDEVTQYIPLTRNHPALALLRLRFIFMQQNGREDVVETKTFLPHLLLVGQARLLTNRMDILASVTNPGFTGRDEVILESPPQPAPEPLSSSSSVRLVDSTTDTLTIEATTDKPAILLVTDAYSRFWKVHALEPSSQQNYEILPADYCLRAVPLAAGHHLLKMEYRPPAFTVGKWVSLVSVLTYFACLGWCVVPTKRRD